jgi:hypothetical protein
MKKLTAILLTCTVLLCAAASCGSKKEKSDQAEAKAETTAAAETTSEEENTETETDDSSNDYEAKRARALTDEKISDDVIKEIETETEKFAEITLKGDVDGLLGCLFPKKIISALKDSGYAETFEDAAALMEGSGELVGCKAENVQALSEEVLRGIEAYYEAFSQQLGVEECKLKAERGYFYSMTVELENDGQKDSSTEDTCIFYFKDEGWKVIPSDPADLIDD